MKLVRDKIPDIIIEAGNSCVVEQISTNREMAVWLKAKMDEESQEFLQEMRFSSCTDSLDS